MTDSKEGSKKTLEVALSLLRAVENNLMTVHAMLEMAEERGIVVDEAAIQRMLEPFGTSMPRERDLINMATEVMAVGSFLSENGVVLDYDEINAHIEKRAKVEEGKKIYWG